MTENCITTNFQNLLPFMQETSLRFMRLFVPFNKVLQFSPQYCKCLPLIAMIASTNQDGFQMTLVDLQILTDFFFYDFIAVAQSREIFGVADQKGATVSLNPPLCAFIIAHVPL